jgi:hypothetical protein
MDVRRVRQTRRQHIRDASSNGDLSSFCARLDRTARRVDPKMMYLRGRDLAAIVVPCNNSRAALASRAKRLGGFHQDSDTNIQIRLAPGLMRADQRAHMLWLVHSPLPPQPRNLRERMPRRDLVYVRLWHFSDGRRQSCDVRCWEFTGPKSAAPEGRLLTKAESWDEE